MSLVPLLFRDWWDDFERPVSLFDQNFGLGLRRNELMKPSLFRSAGYFRPWRLLGRQDSGSSILKIENDKFEVTLDVQQFLPGEVVVKTVDNFLVVEGKHEEKQDEHGFVSRHFVRRYLIPPDTEQSAVVSTLSSDGVLTITAPKKVLPPPGSTERIVHISQTGVPALKQASDVTCESTPQPIVQTP